MVFATADENLKFTWVLRPNQSLSWCEAKLLFAGISAISMVIAISFASLGFWPILPFAGAELALLGIALYLCQSRGHYVEVISVKGDVVAVEKGRGAPAERWDFERAWLQVRLQTARIKGHPSRLVLRSHGRQVSVGDFLVEEERRQVARELQHALGKSSA
tara:strand:- start:181 stop:663 length:483 start_codon:yes stop_codon:yes gene_type:complete